MIIVDFIRQMMLDQINRDHLIVWFDGEKQYESIWPELRDSLPGDVQTAQYEGSFFALRHDIEPAMSQGETAPRLLVYVPLAESETEDALCELQLAGKVMRPGQQPKERNTRLSLVVRNALLSTGNWTPADAEKMERDIEAGKFSSLEEIEKVVRGSSPADSLLQLIFSTNEPSEVALQFLNKSTLDKALGEKNALPELLQLLNTFGTPPAAHSYSEKDTPADIRSALARHVLASDFALGWKGDLPPFVNPYNASLNDPALQLAANVAQQWRGRRDFYKSYELAACDLEQTWQVANLPEDNWQQARDISTFASIEKLLQNGVAKALVAAQETEEMQELIDFAGKRKAAFWSVYQPEKGLSRWELLQALGNVRVAAKRVKQEVHVAPQDAAVYWQFYTQGERSWSELDAAHRRMERLYHRIDSEQSWQSLVLRSRTDYTEVIGRQTHQWLKAWKACAYEVPGISLQRQTWNNAVAPLLKQKHKTAYVLVDALRYEMALELKSTLAQEFHVELETAVGTLPGITKIGMAALLPQAENLELCIEGKNFFPSINGVALKDRQARLKFLTEHAGLPASSIVDVTLDKLLPQPKKAMRDAIKKAKLVVLTSQEIDALCEGDNVPMARRTMDDILGELQRAFRILQSLDVTHIVVTADHGYLFGEELGDDMKIEAPGGDEIELHLRIWLGRGGKAESTFVRESASTFTPTADDTVDICVPAGSGAFKKQGGAQAYFHGGASLQELVIPLMKLHTSARHNQDSNIQWKCSITTEKLTTPFLSVQISGTSKSLLEMKAPKVAVKVMHHKTELKTQTVSATYGLDESSGEVDLKWATDAGYSIDPCTLALMFDHDELVKLNGETVDVVLYDVQTNAELAKAGSLPVDVMN